MLYGSEKSFIFSQIDRNDCRVLKTWPGLKNACQLFKERPAIAVLRS